MPMKKPCASRDNEGDNSTDTASERKSLRADARRNRERVLEVATKVFATEGLAAPIDEIADRAGVGIGTVYRHFPTKEALFEAVIVSFKQHLIEKAQEMLEQDDPDAAFYNFLSLMLRESSVNRSIIAAISSSPVNDHRQLTGISLDFKNILEKLLKHAQEARSVRDDIRVADVTAILFGLARSMEQYSDDPELPERILSVICDGLRGR
ncbi:TetR/AcrR family transcriptional regulator [Alicyclobacillus fastidiosus]|uniref:TetR/AcrR family transcriptional regulator n=1 Tax=Alicyclobacillus fastidiosus TaxID=392011 RepID=A0ABV5ALQ5_9BACL|nr:TetR/AcrR family transcriptional regulator [Alicyclobacillus fastidiosus]WEH08434.1 TetR/AcrR family transcriptional regulator [Alicyclobacillus fastidiosus]